jgi:uncharacterized protein (TIGR02147 family)
MRGKTGLSKKRALEFSKCLKFTQEETAYFVDLVLSECARHPKTRKVAAQRLIQYETPFNSIDVDSFQWIAAWYSIPTMELIRIYGAKATSDFIAKKLGISTDKARQMILRLRRLGILKGNEVVTDFVSLPDGPADKAANQANQDILDKAKVALVQQPVEERNIASTIVRMRKKDLQWASQEIRKFRRKLAARLEHGTEHDSIYSISTQLFRLDRD